MIAKYTFLTTQVHLAVWTAGCANV